MGYSQFGNGSGYGENFDYALELAREADDGTPGGLIAGLLRTGHLRDAHSPDDTVKLVTELGWRIVKADPPATV